MLAMRTNRCEPGDGSGTARCVTRGGHTFGAAGFWSCDNLNEDLGSPGAAR
jgi:hypothetical protein